MIDSAIDPKLRPEQAIFRTGLACIVRDFPFQNITEQCIEWNVPLFTNFIVFEKAFDSVEDLKGTRTTTLDCYHQNEILWARLMQCHLREYSARVIPHQV